MSSAMINMPKMPLGRTIQYILLQLLIVVVTAIVGGAWIFVLVAYGIPWLITGRL